MDCGLFPDFTTLKFQLELKIHFKDSLNWKKILLISSQHWVSRFWLRANTKIIRQAALNMLGFLTHTAITGKHKSKRQNPFVQFYTVTKKGELRELTHNLNTSPTFLMLETCWDSGKRAEKSSGAALIFAPSACEFCFPRWRCFHLSKFHWLINICWSIVYLKV